MEKKLYAKFCKLWVYTAQSSVYFNIIGPTYLEYYACHSRMSSVVADRLLPMSDCSAASSSYAVSDVNCRLATLSTQLGPQTHVICQLATWTCWLIMVCYNYNCRRVMRHLSLTCCLDRRTAVTNPRVLRLFGHLSYLRQLLKLNVGVLSSESGCPWNLDLP